MYIMHTEMLRPSTSLCIARCNIDLTSDTGWYSLLFPLLSSGFAAGRSSVIRGAEVDPLILSFLSLFVSFSETACVYAYVSSSFFGSLLIGPQHPVCVSSSFSLSDFFFSFTPGEFEGLGPPDLCCLEKVLQKDVSMVAKVLESVTLDEPFQQHSSSSSLSPAAATLNNESAFFCQ